MNKDIKTKREEIREGLYPILKDLRNTAEILGRVNIKPYLDKVLSYLHKEGVVIKGHNGIGFEASPDKTYWDIEPLIGGFNHAKAFHDTIQDGDEGKSKLKKDAKEQGGY